MLESFDTHAMHPSAEAADDRHTNHMLLRFRPPLSIAIQRVRGQWQQLTTTFTTATTQPLPLPLPQVHDA